MNPPPPPSPKSTATRLRLHLSNAAVSAVRSGHPWVFSDSIQQSNRPGTTGELAIVYDRNDRFLGIGLFDAESPLRVRMLHTGKPVNIDPAWWRSRLTAAFDRRAGLFDATTTGRRWIYGESDGWPGLVLDRYADTLVLKLYTAAWLPWLNEIADLIQSILQPAQLVLRLSRNQQVTASALGWTDGCLLRSAGATHPGVEPRTPVEFLENGIRLEAEVVKGQKTGFFLDQRDNRSLVETLSRGAEVLNAFSFSGGFSLYAARGGARSVTDLDISPHALESARRNFALNATDPRIAAVPHDQVKADAFEWLASPSNRLFDLVILDPPSLAKREHERTRATEAYGRLAANGIGKLRPGGMLVAASCSAHVTAAEFFDAVRSAARASRRPFSEWKTTGHPPDHRATFPEAAYLKCIYLRF